MKPITFDDMLEEAEREVAMRKQVYARLVGKGEMRPDQAERRIAVMAEIAKHLREQVESQPDLFEAGAV